jgi:hypothetical protein
MKHGSYDWVFTFDDPKVDIHMAFGQGIFTVDNSVERKCDKICYARNFGNHYQKYCHEDVVSALSHNHKATWDAIYKRNESLHLNGAIKCNCAKGRLETSPSKGEACRSTFDLDSSYQDEGELQNMC